MGYQSANATTTTTTTSTSHESTTSNNNTINHDHQLQISSNINNSSFFDPNFSGLEGPNPNEIKWSEYLQTPLILAHQSANNNNSNNTNTNNYGEIKEEGMQFMGASSWQQNQQSPMPLVNFPGSDMYSKDLQRLSEAFGQIF